jgi:uncharacterized membrane protein YphA (DoxX/SURF4 family)
MIMDPETGTHLALFSARTVAGILFFTQGYDKLFVLGISKAAEPFIFPFQQKKIPPGLLHIALSLSTFIEFACGILLIAGFMRNPALYLLVINMVGVAACFSMVRPMWDMNHYFPRFVLLLLLLLLPAEWDAWRLDSLMGWI